MKKGYFICSVICIILCLISIVGIIYLWPRDADIQKPVSTDTDTDSITISDVKNDNENTDSTQEYKSPIDFKKLKSQNPDIYAWIEIPGTKVSYPIVQRANDDEYYLRYDINGVRNTNGAIFTESTYSDTQFYSKVTPIYGHRTISDAMFGTLESLYGGDIDFSKHNEVVIYLPNKELHYKVFAATTHGNEHIMYTHNRFESNKDLEDFVNGIYNTDAKDANFDKSVEVTGDDKIIVLSTCLRYDRTRRFLVLAKLI